MAKYLNKSHIRYHSTLVHYQINSQMSKQSQDIRYSTSLISD